MRPLSGEAKNIKRNKKMKNKKIKKKLKKLVTLGLFPKKGIVSRIKSYEDDDDFVQQSATSIGGGRP